MSDFDDAVSELTGGTPPVAPPPAASKKREKPAVKHKGPAKETSVVLQIKQAKRVRIVLEENEGIPPGGQFIGLNGYGFNLVPGVEVDVPEPLLDILDNAKVSKPVLDKNLRVVGWREVSRLPYRIVRSKKAG